MVFFLGQLYGFCSSATYVFHNIFMLLFHIQMGTFLETNGHFLLPLLFLYKLILLVLLGIYIVLNKQAHFRTQTNCCYHWILFVIFLIVYYIICTMYGKLLDQTVSFFYTYLLIDFVHN